MIQKNELRIGNLYDHSGRVKKVTPIVIEALFESERIWCKAIPLTEEWLIKLGLKKIEEYCFELDDIHVNTKRELIWIMTKCKRELEFNIPNYIHELQNLYFALTNKELNYETTTI